MQAAGALCHHCHERILLTTEGLGCPVCKVAWHLNCQENANACPVCGKDAKVAAREVAEERQKEYWAQLDRGRSRYWWMLGLRAASGVVFGVVYLLEDAAIYNTRGLIPAGELERIFRSAGRNEFVAIIVFGAIWAGAYFGKTAFRYWLGFTALLGLALSFLIFASIKLPDGFSGIRHVYSSKRPSVDLSLFLERHPVAISLALVSTLYVFYMCLFSRVLKDYEYALRAQRMKH